MLNVRMFGCSLVWQSLWFRVECFFWWVSPLWWPVCSHCWMFAFSYFRCRYCFIASSLLRVNKSFSQSTLSITSEFVPVSFSEFDRNVFAPHKTCLSFFFYSNGSPTTNLTSYYAKYIRARITYNQGYPCIFNMHCITFWYDCIKPELWAHLHIFITALMSFLSMSQIGNLLCIQRFCNIISHSGFSFNSF